MIAKARVLVDEEDEPSRVLISDVLRARGYDVLPATNGQDAVILASLHCPEIIMIDLQMPVVAGLDATQLLKASAATRAIPIVAVTASAMSGDEKHFRQMGCDAILVKPTTPSEILQMVRHFVLPQEER
jgi:two-component system cell cycle response regulator DivK